MTDKKTPVNDEFEKFYAMTITENNFDSFVVQNKEQVRRLFFAGAAGTISLFATDNIEGSLPCILSELQEFLLEELAS